VKSGLAIAAVPAGPVHVLVGSDYFRLSWHREVRTFLAASIRQGAVDVAASRVTTGNLPVYVEAEKALASWMGTPAAVLTSSGYSAPMVAAQALASRCDGAVLVRGTHPCLRDAAMASGLEMAEVSGPDELMETCRTKGWQRPLLLQEGVGPLTGRMRPLAPWLNALPAEGTCLFDDAHGVGTLGVRGRGALELEGLRDSRVVVAFTLSKAFGLYGGAIAGPRWLAGAVWGHSRAARGGTPIPPAYAAAVPIVLRLLSAEGTRWRARIEQHRERMLPVMEGAVGAEASGHVGPVFGIVPRDAAAQRRLSKGLRAAGIEPPFIQYPGGPEAGLFRFSLSSAHASTVVSRLATVLEGRRGEWRMWGEGVPVGPVPTKIPPCDAGDAR
jgi:7-keto-8-aminopelargonate synthetase-like enzyme